MALTPADFLRPVGRLDPELLGGSELAGATLSALVSAAEALTSDEAAQECFVYWKTFEQVADDFTSAPIMERDRNKTDQWSTEQLDRWRSIAREYEGCFKRSISGTTGYQPGTTVSKEVTPTW